MQTINPTNLDDPALYINRDLSWLEFNRHVLEEARDSTVPMLERLKFLAIFSSNLDEFFMVRVGGTQQKVAAGIPTGWRAPTAPKRAKLDAIRRTVAELVAEQYRCLMTEVLPFLQERGILSRSASELTEGPAHSPPGTVSPRNLSDPYAAGHRPGSPVPAPAQQVAEHRRGPAPARRQRSPLRRRASAERDA